MPLTPPQSTHWSKLSVTLHWLIVALIVVQFLDHEFMVDAWRAWHRGNEIDGAIFVGARVHVIAGILVLAATVLRLWDRYTHGRPPYPAEEPNWAKTLARLTHWLIYAILIAMPVTGLLAWFAGVDDLGEVHEILWTPLLVLTALHIAGALAQHFWFRSESLKRIVRLA